MLPTFSMAVMMSALIDPAYGDTFCYIMRALGVSCFSHNSVAALEATLTGCSHVSSGGSQGSCIVGW